MAGTKGVDLSPREYEIVRLVSRDLTNKQIAKTLEISPWTVATHLRRVYAKLGVHSKAAMVAQVLMGGKRSESLSALTEPGVRRRE